MKIILPILFVSMGALLVWLLFGNKPTVTKVETPEPPKPGATDVPTLEKSQITPPWILLSNAVSNYTA